MWIMLLIKPQPPTFNNKPAKIIEPETGGA